MYMYTYIAVYIYIYIHLFIFTNAVTTSTVAADRFKPMPRLTEIYQIH